MSYDDPFNSNGAPNGDEASNSFSDFNNEDSAGEFLERELGDITGNGDANSYESLGNGIQRTSSSSFFSFIVINQ